MKVLMAGDIVGSRGRQVFARTVAELKGAGKVDFVVVNAENAAGGTGITGAVADELFAAGADVLTLGDHTWDRKEAAGYLDREPRIVRPANFAPGCPGRGWTTVDAGVGRVTVINLVGRVFMRENDCPFRTIDRLLDGGAALGTFVIVDLHAEATSEKIVMGRYLDGRVSLVAGTHTHVQTSDEKVLPKGTAYITDLGMTGVTDSAIGRDLASVTNMFLTGMPSRFKLAQGEPVLEGVLANLDNRTGRARSLKRIRKP